MGYVPPPMQPIPKGLLPPLYPPIPPPGLTDEELDVFYEADLENIRQWAARQQRIRMQGLIWGGIAGVATLLVFALSAILGAF